MINTIYNEDCILTMQRMGKIIDFIMTSPPYNMTYRKGGAGDSGRYDVYRDWMEESEYIEWIVNLFNSFDKILKDNKSIAFNFGYSIENPGLPYKLVAEIEKSTPFQLVDTIVWKKPTGMPIPAMKHRLCRTWEFVFIFCRKTEIDTFDCYKRVSSVSQKTGQIYYDVVYNYIEAKNNNGVCPYNQATYSTELVEQVLKVYATTGDTIYDPFMGSGTTAVASKKMGMNYIGSEISKDQCIWAENRIRESTHQSIENKESLWD